MAIATSGDGQWAPLMAAPMILSSSICTQAPRPVEPVIRRGRGMHLLGFMPLGGFKTQPLMALGDTAPPAGGKGSAGKGAAGKDAGGNTASAGAAQPSKAHDCDGVVRGPSSWKNGRPVHTFGNYPNYYTEGHRPVNGSEEVRLQAVVDKLGQVVFKDKDVLDIGCNTGFVSFAAGTRFQARRVVGVDIDAGLIEEAERATRPDSCEFEFRAEDFMSCPLRRGDAGVERFDAVLCLSVTKWVHYIHGDDGVRRLFKRILKRLRPGGVLVLEPQEWSSYKKKRHLSPEIRQTVAGIEMRPEHFPDCLLGLGFEHVSTIAPPKDGSSNLQRAMVLMRKPTLDTANAELASKHGASVAVEASNQRASVPVEPDAPMEVCAAPTVGRSKKTKEPRREDKAEAAESAACGEKVSNLADDVFDDSFADAAPPAGAKVDGDALHHKKKRLDEAVAEAEPEERDAPAAELDEDAPKRKKKHRTKAVVEEEPEKGEALPADLEEDAPKREKKRRKQAVVDE